MDVIKKDETYSEDARKKEEADLQKITDEAIKKVDAIVKEKETEILSI